MSSRSAHVRGSGDAIVYPRSSSPPPWGTIAKVTLLFLALLLIGGGLSNLTRTHRYRYSYHSWGWLQMRLGLTLLAAFILGMVYVKWKEWKSSSNPPTPAPMTYRRRELPLLNLQSQAGSAEPSPSGPSAPFHRRSLSENRNIPPDPSPLILAQTGRPPMHPGISRRESVVSTESGFPIHSTHESVLASLRGRLVRVVPSSRGSPALIPQSTPTVASRAPAPGVPPTHHSRTPSVDSLSSFPESLLSAVGSHLVTPLGHSVPHFGAGSVTSATISTAALSAASGWVMVKKSGHSPEAKSFERKGGPSAAPIPAAEPAVDPNSIHYLRPVGPEEEAALLAALSRDKLDENTLRDLRDINAFYEKYQAVYMELPGTYRIASYQPRTDRPLIPLPLDTEVKAIQEYLRLPPGSTKAPPHAFYRFLQIRDFCTAFPGVIERGTAGWEQIIEDNRGPSPAFARDVNLDNSARDLGMIRRGALDAPPLPVSRAGSAPTSPDLDSFTSGEGSR